MDRVTGGLRPVEPEVRDDAAYAPPPPRRRPVEPSRPPGRQPAHPRSAERRPSEHPSERPVAPIKGSEAIETSGSRLRGAVAVVAIFLITLAAGFIDYFAGEGLGTITLVALVAATAIATLTVRRRDLVTVVLSPPLVFVGVAAANIAVAPSLVLSAPTVATMLIRGFPTMAVATVAAIILAVVRVVTKR